MIRCRSGWYHLANPQPNPAPRAPPPPAPNQGCHAGCTPCVPIASDVDCEGGSGDESAYVRGPVTVIGSDVYRLDGDEDGIGCERAALNSGVRGRGIG
ncbi:hypothetical protein [Saccharothrix sp. ALI-22-I]|uniref:hypothetical protein n=1 Tax=Saccharothrix sp. ALI-22-I TaxID=1933778 RepID=UPI001930E4EE|nr:hypothetical protein [Saccharothrix sp. ALI-22-I]